MTQLDTFPNYKASRSAAPVKEFGARRAVEEIHRELDGVLNGVHLSIVVSGSLTQTVKHDLGRVPRGCVFTRQRIPGNQCVLEGDEVLGILPATETEAGFVFFDPPGSEVRALVF